MTHELTDEDFKIVQALVNEHGSDCPGLDYETLRAFAERHGIWEPEPDPTPEELARREALQNSEYGQQMARIFKRCNEDAAKMLIEQLEAKTFFDGADWPNDGATLRIRLPKDYIVTKK